MPVLINDLQQSQPVVKTYNPKFFSDKLTGRGGTTAGLLSAKNNPLMIKPNTKTANNDICCTKKTYNSGMTHVWQIPMNPLLRDAWYFMDEMKRPNLGDMVLIGTTTKSKAELYMSMEINSLILSETSVKTQNGLGPTVLNRDLKQNYQLTFYTVIDPTNDVHKNVHTSATIGSVNDYRIEFSSNPLSDLQTDIYQDLTSAGFKIDTKCIVDYISTYDIYDSVVRRSEQWQTNVDELLSQYFENIAKYHANDSSALATTKCLVQHIMNYDIPLDLYRNIYNAIKKNFSASDANGICKQNLNLLLSDTMDNLNTNKPYIQSFTAPSPAIVLPPSVQRLSPEQGKAVQSTEPLILVQAGAGTGKSTLILGRIDYLSACGIDQSDIMVLSFTNAAAENIKLKNHNVNSMTIASMIHEIYSANFQGHELSSLDTIINSLDIYYPQALNAPTTQNNFINDFQHKLRAIAKNDANNFTNMNNFIEENYDEVIKTLDTIHQTSLELEIIICYQQINNLIEPASVSSKFLIMDEVQDNSIFEFVYTLKYIDKHKESLFIVGDCSQTLYEFRASNPRALNILEGSKTFATFQLNVNYRSNQEILDFANIALQNIEANQYANIQLQANSLAPVTEQSFLDKITLNYHRLDKVSKFREALPSIFAKEITPYIKDCLMRGEQVAFLMFTRRDVALTQSILEAQFPTMTTVSLVPEKMYNSTIMSAFIKKYWGQMSFAPITNTSINVTGIIYQEIMAQLQYLVYEPISAAPRVQTFLSKWRQEQGPTIQMWTNQVINGQMTNDVFLDLLKENMLQYEIKSNAIKQSLLSARNQQNKQNDNVANANFLLSTIHSAKGLEFDNVVVFYRNENALDEEKKRMYYVAFTRAMKSEYVLAYDTCASPQIQADYVTVLEKLHAVSPAVNSPLNKAPAGKRIKI